MKPDKIKALEHEIEAERDRLARAALYAATRTHHRHVPASEVLNWIRSKDRRVTQYPKWGAPYNPRIDGQDHVRWIENIGEAGLRSCGFADEIVSSIEHKGWYADPHGFDDNVYRGIVCQLPARNGFPQYVYGYADPNNEGAALIDSDIIEGQLNGDEDNASAEIFAAARAADSMAQRYAEEEKDYQMKESARIAAEEKRDEAKEKHATLREHIIREREKIAELNRDAANLIDEPWQLFA